VRVFEKGAGQGMGCDILCCVLGSHGQQQPRCVRNGVHSIQRGLHHRVYGTSGSFVSKPSYLQQGSLQCAHCCACVHQAQPFQRSHVHLSGTCFTDQAAGSSYSLQQFSGSISPTCEDDVSSHVAALNSRCTPPQVTCTHTGGGMI
jgi:hypothetical protein